MSIVQNKKAFYDYFIEQRFEAGIALEGWEVKAIRAGRAQIKEAYVIVSNSELLLLGCHITPLPTASLHVQQPLPSCGGTGDTTGHTPASFIIMSNSWVTSID